MRYCCKILIAVFMVHAGLFANAQNVTELVNRMKTKMDKVNDYTATGILKTDVAFIKAPVSKVMIYFKKPDHFKLVKRGGISVLPKGSMNVNIGTVMGTDNFTALDAGEAVVDKIKTKVVKLLPNDENDNVVLSTLYIDASRLLILKAITTTKENGTYELNLYYGKYAAYALPDKVQFSFNTKNYKLPKGITLDFDENTSPAEMEKLKNKKGKIEIDYSSYIINKGVDDAVFK